MAPKDRDRSPDEPQQLVKPMEGHYVAPVAGAWGTERRLGIHPEALEQTDLPGGQEVTVHQMGGERDPLLYHQPLKVVPAQEANVKDVSKRGVILPLTERLRSLSAGDYVAINPNYERGVEGLEELFSSYLDLNDDVDFFF